MPIDPTLLAAAATIMFAIISGLIGLSYRNLLSRVRNIEQETETFDETREELGGRIDMLQNYLFGAEPDPEDMGLSTSVTERFEVLEEEVEEIKQTLDKYDNK